MTKEKIKLERWKNQKKEFVMFKNFSVDEELQNNVLACLSNIVSFGEYYLHPLTPGSRPLALRR
jgi:succinate dehydrogenase/fumarate reductase-like Fe-S protein